ncbi:MAG: hypothetical protein HYR71_03405 [Chloroflexi bacterium]|nr:hypothetical protein [Chloroflexota bacterium]
MTATPSSDAVGQAYVEMALAIEQHQPGTIDAYFGPSSWKAAAEAAGKRPLDELAARARELAAAVSASDWEPQRKHFLSKQVAAMQTSLRLLAGASVPFAAEVEALYDITPVRVDDAVFEEAKRELEGLLPGDGSLNERLRALRKRFEIPLERALELFECAKEETRARTRALFALPAEEDVELRLVKDKPWGAYNWYRGGHRSLIELNTDSPVHVNGMVGLLAHEGYPGHHTEHAIKEQALYEQRGWIEACVLLINAPECVVSEGIATSAAEAIFEEGEMEQWMRAELYPRAGVQDILSLEDTLKIQRASQVLGRVGNNAALMIHVDGQPDDVVIEYLLRYSGRTREEAARNIRFMKDPLFRSYIFTYSYGHDLMKALFAKYGKRAVFERALSEPLTPSGLRAWLSA